MLHALKQIPGLPDSVLDQIQLLDTLASDVANVNREMIDLPSTDIAKALVKAKTIKLTEEILQKYV